MSFVSKIFWLFSLWPLIIIFDKIRKKRDLTAFDVVLTFNSIYYAFSPLVSKAKDFSLTGYDSYVVTDENTVVTMAFYNIFTFLVALTSSLYDRSAFARGSNVVNLTVFLRNWYANFIVSNYKILLWWILLLVQLYYDFTILSWRNMYYATGVSVTQIRDASGLMKFLPDIGESLRVVLSVYLSVYIIKKKKTIGLNLIDKISIIVFLIRTFTLSRTFQIEMFLSCLLVAYSVSSKRLTLKHATYGLCAVLFLYLLVFPCLYYYRSANAFYRMETGKNSFGLIKYDALQYASKRNFKVENNSGSRKTFVYSILSKSVDYKDKNYGELTKVVLNHTLPSSLAFDKTTQNVLAEGVIQQKLSYNIDCADTMLLFANMDYGNVFGPFVAFGMLIALLGIWNKYYKIVTAFVRNDLVSLYFFYQILTYCERTEISADSYIGMLYHAIYVIVGFFVISKVFNYTYNFLCTKSRL